MLELTRRTTLSLDLIKSLEDLDNGATSHTHWLKQVHSALICEDQPPSEDDISEDAHHRCNFGHWYYGQQHSELDNQPLFQAIGDHHRVMHAFARTILRMRQSGKSVSSTDYNAFIEKAIDFKLAIRELQNKIIDELCIIDHLTGAFNRHAMSIKLAQEHGRVMRKGGYCALVMIDIDHFKEVNDTYGHTIGDQVLRSIVERLSNQLRTYDYLFRYGGEEFLVCMPDSDCPSAEHLMERLRLDLEESPLQLEGGMAVPITASFGISLLSADNSVEDAVNEADRALLYAKSSGRNRVYRWQTN